MIDALIQSAVLFALVAIVTKLLKRSAPASVRHMLWAFAIVGALVAPLVARLSPLEVSVVPALEPSSAPAVGASSDQAIEPSARPAPGTANGPPKAEDDASVREPDPTAGTPDPRPRRIAWMTVIAIAWAIGAIVLLTRVIHGLVTVNRIASRAKEITDPAWMATIDRAIATTDVRKPVEVRMTDETPVPYTCGLAHPTIVLPLSASEWNAERRDAVLRHELAHISRGDLAMNILSHVTRALYWPNPLAWIAANGLRYEGERAADDEVLRTGAKASDYADHLLDIVKSVGQPIPKIALAMARSSDFEGRLLAILEPGVPRSRLGRARTAAIAATFMIALVPLTAMTTAAPAPSPVPTPTVSLQTHDSSTPEPVMTAAPQTPPESTVAKRAPVSAPERPMNTTPLPQASSAIVALGEALSDSDASVRLAAVNSLGGLQDPAAIAALAKAMREDTDARVREAAAWALGEIDDNRAVPHLLEALKAERVAKVRVKIVEALEQIDDASAVNGVIAALKDGSAEVRRAAVDALGEFEDLSAVGALASMTRDDDVEVRRNVAQALGQLEDASTIEALKTMARDRDAEVRANAIEALHHFESEALVPVFITALKDSNAHVREHAADALGSIDELRTAPSALIEALNDSNRDVRRNAASALGNIGDEAAVPALRRVVANADAETRRSAVEALKDIGGAEAVTALMGLLKDSDPEVRKMAAEALGRKRP